MLAGAFAIGLLSFGSSSCTCHREASATVPHISGVAVEHDLPYDYLSGKYRQLFRTDPQWFHRHSEPDYYNPYVSK